MTCPYFFPSVRVIWCSYVSVVIFSNSFVINSLSGFSVPFSVISVVAQCTLHEFAFQLELWSRLIIIDTDTLHAYSADLES